MKKLLILFLATGIFISCDNNKGMNNNDRNNDREKDDYRDRSNKEEKLDRNSGKYDDVVDDDEEGNHIPDVTNWTSSEVREFVTSCVREAVKGGMQRTKAEDYCECMQKKLEYKYPDTKDVVNIDMESPSIKRLVNECLGLGKGNPDDSYSSGGWTRSDEDRFVNDCISTARKNVGQSRAEEYCECMLRKVKRMYSTYNEADRGLKGISQAEIEELAEDCNY